MNSECKPINNMKIETVKQFLTRTIQRHSGISKSAQSVETETGSAAIKVTANIEPEPPG